jgi:hypothetical protein
VQLALMLFIELVESGRRSRVANASIDDDCLRMTRWRTRVQPGRDDRQWPKSQQLSRISMPRLAPETRWTVSAMMCCL